MIIQLEQRGLIRWIPRQARSIELLVSSNDRPALHPVDVQVEPVVGIPAAERK